MRKLQLVFLSLLVSVLFAGCSKGVGTFSADKSANTNANSAYPAPRSNETAAAKQTSSNTGGREESPLRQQVSLEQADKSQAAPVVTERKILRDADLTLETGSPDETQAKITTIAESKGGFVIESKKQSNDTKTTKTDFITMTIRVPAAKFDESLDEIRKSANGVIVETVKGQDVTEEFIDIEARLKTQKALEAQFLEIMKQAKTVEDALKVQTEIARVRGEIERVEGRKRFLENQASFSTIRIRLETPAAFSASSSGFFYQLSQAVSDGFNAAMTFVLMLVTLAIALLPFLIFIVLPIYLLIRYFLRRDRKQKLASEIAREEIKNE